MNKTGWQEIYQVSEARRPALEGEQLVFPPDQGLSFLQALTQAGLWVGMVGCGLWYAGSQLQWLCGAEPRFGFSMMLQLLLFIMSLVVLETEEKNSSNRALLLHSRQHLLSLSKTVYGCIIKPWPEKQRWVQNLPKKLGKTLHPPNFPKVLRGLKGLIGISQPCYKYMLSNRRQYSCIYTYIKIQFIFIFL